jgi:ATP-dependent Clp protease ATP-binding subunit ClpB
MDFNRLTEKAQQSLVAARDLATRNGQTQIDPEHLLLALLEQEGGVASSIIEKAGLSPESLRERIHREVARLPKVSGGSDPNPSGRLNRVFLKAEDEARSLKDDFIAVEHLLLGLLDDAGVCGRLLKDVGLNRDRLLAGLKQVRGNARVTTQNPKALTRHSRNMAAI